LQNEPLWLVEGHIILANQKIAEQLGGPFLLRNGGGLNRALSKPRTLWNWGDTNVANAGSTLLLGLAREEPFEIANLQTAFASCCLFLKANGYTFVLKDSPQISEFLERAKRGTLRPRKKSDDLFYHTMRQCIWATSELT